MMFRIEELPLMQIVYLRRTGPYGSGNKELMEKLKFSAAENGLMRDDATILGIARDNPAITPPENCRYDACIVVAKNYAFEDAEVCASELPGGKYAVFVMEHTAAALQKAWQDIFPALAGQGVQIDTSRPVLERYIPRMVNAHICEICVPVL